MVDRPISDLLANNPAVTLTGTEAVHAIQGSPYASVGMMVDQIKDFVLTGLAAASVGYTPAGSVAATDVQAAITELDSDRAALAATLAALNGTAVAYTPAGNIAATTVSGAISELDTEKVAKAGDSMTGALTVASLTTNSRLITDSGTTVTIERYQNNANGAQAIYRKYRGTYASPLAVSAGDGGARFSSSIWDGTADRFIGFLDFSLMSALEGVTVGSTHPSALLLNLVRPGALATNGVSDPVFRFTYGLGFEMYGSNSVIDGNRHFQLRSYTMGTLPSAATAGQLIYVSDAPSRVKLAVSDGTSWNFSDGPLTENGQTATYTLVLADGNSRHVKMNVAGANNLTVPPNSSVAFAIGVVINVSQMGAGQTTINPGVGVTLRSSNGLKLRAQYSAATLIKIGTDEWLVSGDTTT